MSRTSTSESVFSERLMPKIPGLLPLTLLIPAVWLILLPLSNSSSALAVAFIVFCAVTAVRLLMAKKIVASAEVLKLGTVSIKTKDILKIEILDKYQIRQALGPELDARSIRFFSSSANYLLKISVTNAAYPYVLVSTNNPDKLQSALQFNS